jgi:hypothetical protein
MKKLVKQIVNINIQTVVSILISVSGWYLLYRETSWIVCLAIFLLFWGDSGD